MGTILINDLQAGMVLASDLKGSGGRMLLPAGVELQDIHLKTLKAWGITEVAIQGDAEVAEELPVEHLIDDGHRQRSREWLLPFFNSGELEKPVGDILLHWAIDRKAAYLAGSHPLPPHPWQEPAVTDTEPVDERIWQKLPKQPEALLRGKLELASLPDVYSQIVEALNSPSSSAALLADMVSKDASLASRLLKLVNSVFYGLPTRVDAISRAITLIGTNELTTMALGISVVNAFKDIPAGLVSMEGFWRHSIACGIFARLLSANKVGVSAEQMFVGGLLHDIGRMVMLKQIPEAYSEVIREARRQRQPLFILEKRLLGFDHMDVGTLLCREWNFSKALEEMVDCHHYPGRGRYALGCSLVHLADIMAKVYFIGQGESGCVMISPLQDRAWEALDISPEQLGGVFNQADQQIHEVIHLFLGEEGNE